MKKRRFIMSVKKSYTLVIFLSLIFLFVGCSKKGDSDIGTTSYSYDDSGRLTEANYGNGISIKYTYDKNGNLLTKETAGGAL